MNDIPPAARRRRFLVKGWLQVRYLLLLGLGTAGGGAVYALVLQGLLRRRIQPDLAASYSTVGQGDLWLSLYPTVAAATLVLAAAVSLLVFLLIRVFADRVSRASAELEQYYRELAEGAETDGAHAGRISLPEFRALAESTAAMVDGYRRKWSAVAAKAETALGAVPPLEGAADPTARLLALRDCERRCTSLVESCRSRRRGRE
jgi:hypothetical protein